MRDVVSSFRSDLYAGHRVLVSGGSSGIGLAIAQGFAALGAEVIATGSSTSKLEANRQDPASKGIRFEILNVRDAKAVKALVSGLDSLDILINAAGVAKPIEEFEEETFLEVMDINLNASMRLAMAARPLLAKRGGSIINIASMLSYIADAAVPAYGASKTGVLGLTRHLAHAFGKDNIRVNAISPGYHKTDMTKGLWSDPVNAEKIAAKTAPKRWGTTDDLVGAALFLASPAAVYVTGADLPVDGGYVVSGF